MKSNTLLIVDVIQLRVVGATTLKNVSTADGELGNPRASQCYNEKGMTDESSAIPFFILFLRIIPS